MTKKIDFSPGRWAISVSYGRVRAVLIERDSNTMIAYRDTDFRGELQKGTSRQSKNAFKATVADKASADILVAKMQELYDIERECINKARLKCATAVAKLLEELA